MPIEATGFKEDPKQLPRPTLTISNLAIIALNIGNMSNVLNAVNQVTFANDLVGAKLKRRRTLKAKA